MRFVYSSLIAAVIVLSPALVRAQMSDSLDINAQAGVVEPSGEGWVIISADSINFFYLPGANLRKLEARLRYRDVPITQEFRAFLSNSSLSIEERLAARLEIILLRVKQILGMDPKGFSVKIWVFKTRQDLDNEYTRMFNSPSRLKSFYVHKVKGIFSNEQDFLDSVIAHELGHAVIDHYFLVPPPPAMAELMACYVDAHLDQY